MATYSNTPAVSGQVYSVGRASTGAWTNAGNNIFYLVLYSCPANSYAIINGGIRTNNNYGNIGIVGLTLQNPTNFENSNSTSSRITISTCFAVDDGTSSNYLYRNPNFETIYVGPGQTVYAVVASNLGINPNIGYDFHFAGVQFTNGL